MEKIYALWFQFARGISKPGPPAGHISLPKASMVALRLAHGSLGWWIMTYFTSYVPRRRFQQWTNWGQRGHIDCCAAFGAAVDRPTRASLGSSRALSHHALACSPCFVSFSFWTPYFMSFLSDFINNSMIIKMCSLKVFFLKAPLWIQHSLQNMFCPTFLQFLRLHILLPDITGCPEIRFSLWKNAKERRWNTPISCLHMWTAHSLVLHFTSLTTASFNFPLSYVRLIWIQQTSSKGFRPHCACIHQY